MKNSLKEEYLSKKIIYFFLSKIILALLGIFIGPINVGFSILPLSVRRLYFNIMLCIKNFISFIASCLPGHLNNLIIIGYNIYKRLKIKFNS